MRLIKLDELKPGMIALSGGNEFIQKAIKFFTRSMFSHSFALMQGPYKILSSFETTSTIVSGADIAHKWEEDDYIQVWDVLEASDDEKRKSLKKLYKEYAKTRYGYESYLWFIYRAICRLFKYEPKIMWKWVSNGVTCTELSCYYLYNLNAIYRALFDGLDFNTLSPQELYNIMIFNPNLFKQIGWIKNQNGEKLDIEEAA
jgi:hypothetical protein